jgi:hypothetical protein
MSTFDLLDGALAEFLQQEAAAAAPPADLVQGVLGRTADRAPRTALLARARAVVAPAPLAGLDLRMIALAATVIAGAVLLVLTFVAGSRPRPVRIPVLAELAGTWLADTGPLPSIGAAGPRVRLVVDRNGRAMHLETGTAGVAVMRGTLADGADTITITSDEAGLGCRNGDVGDYAGSLSDDGVRLVLTPRSDACQARASALRRTWSRSLDGPSSGGRGVVAVFDPAVVVTLPRAAFDATSYNDAIEIGSTAGTFYAIKDPQGLSAPCTATGGQPVSLPVDLDAYEAYVRGLPGFAVTRTDLRIDGHPAMHLSVASDASVDCPGRVVIEWIAKADAPDGVTWHLAPGDPDSLYLVALPDHVYLFQYLGAAVTTADELQVMDTITFADGLAGTP